MPRIEPIDPDQAQGKAKAILDGVRQSSGQTPNLLRTMAQSPAVLDAYFGFGRALGAGSLSAGVREQIAVAVSAANGCEYCTAAHTALGRQLGVADDELAAALTSASGDPKVEAALRFAVRIVEARGWVGDDDLERVREAGYGDGEVAEIIATVAHSIFSNYFNHVAQTEVDFPRVEIGVPA